MTGSMMNKWQVCRDRVRWASIFALLTAAAGFWLVAEAVTAPRVVELPRVVILGPRLPAGSCLVPVEPADAACPVPMQTVEPVQGRPAP